VEECWSWLPSPAWGQGWLAGPEKFWKNCVHSGAFLAHTSVFVGGNCVKHSIVWILPPVHLFPQKDQVMITLVKQNCA